MGTLHEAYWASTGYGSSRRQRQSGTYRWFLPSRIADSNPTLSFSTVALVTAASERISQAPEDHRVYTDGITRMLLRSEAVDLLTSKAWSSAQNACSEQSCTTSNPIMCATTQARQRFSAISTRWKRPGS